MTLSSIQAGSVFVFAVDDMLGNAGCNLCEFFHALYTHHVENDYRHTFDPPNTIIRKTTLLHFIQVDIHSIECKGNLTVVEMYIADTWYGNRTKRRLYFRDLCSSGITDWDGDSAHGTLSTWADLALARNWLRECIRDHTDCAPFVSVGLTSVFHHSTRFIDVLLGRLVKLDQINVRVPVEYIALSYVWGKDYQLRTTLQTVEKFSQCLSADDSEAVDRLPKTIQDAISVTRALGYRFLWVDALCIVQDSPTDLGIQLAQMDRIYSLAAVTIVARGSSSSDSGMLGVSIPRNQIKHSNTEVTVNRGLSVGVWDVIGSVEEYQETHGEFADRRFYVWRGWTFQEQILSTRNLEFNSKRMMFRCGRDYSFQESGYPATASRDMRDPNHFRHAIRQFKRFQANPSLTSGLPSHKIMTEDMLIARTTLLLFTRQRHAPLGPSLRGWKDRKEPTEAIGRQNQIK
ncbi:HET-domain-containing protein [Dendrothele bispora CBS 962.96]|uniref:HET-domain-containing protein n=1 Tax=Dendrothele bispora (strain CBS 962.96) TaxID=1314807 RepID=A0A4S8L4D5_DENBC|nr:HET-domain-containing protein [Dendrothele bispora CBS 962.96]